MQFHLLTKFVQFHSRISIATAGQIRAVLFRAIPKIMSIRAIPFPSNSALPSVAFQINSIPDVDTYQLKFTANLDILFQWTDYRLKFNNLKEDNKTNALSMNEMLAIWTPQIHFQNSLSSLHTKVDGITNMGILREGGFRYVSNVEDSGIN